MSKRYLDTLNFVGVVLQSVLCNFGLKTTIVRFLDEVQSHSDDNKMSVQNLATVFGPNILRPRVEDRVTMMEGQQSCDWTLQ